MPVADDDRKGQQAFAAPAKRAFRFQPRRSLLPGGRGQCLRTEVDGAHPPPVSRAAVLRFAADDRMASDPGACDQSKTVAAFNAAMGLLAIYQRPYISQRALSQHVSIHTCCAGSPSSAFTRCGPANIGYIQMAHGFLYLVAVMDWVSRYVLSWRWSNLIEAGFCIRCTGGGAAKGSTRDLQYRSGQSVHRCWLRRPDHCKSDQRSEG